MRYEVRCTARDCFLHDPQRFGELSVATILANAHEEVWIDAPEAHVTILKDLEPVQTSVEPEAGGKETPLA